MSWGCDSVLEHLPSNPQTLGFTLQYQKKKIYMYSPHTFFSKLGEKNKNLYIILRGTLRHECGMIELI
jgi:hypothetical protein